MKRWKRFLCGEIDNPARKMDIDCDDQQSENNRLITQLKETQRREIERVLKEAAQLALEELEPEFIHAARSCPIRPRVSTILHKKKRGNVRGYLTSDYCLKFIPYAPLESYSPLYLAERISAHLPYHWDAHAASPGFVNFRYPTASLVNVRSRHTTNQRSHHTPPKRRSYEVRSF